MKYKIRLLSSAEKELNKLSTVTCIRISKNILSLEDNPRPRGVKKLSNRDEYRLRVGAYRILYTVSDHDSTVIIIAVGHRREIYR